MSFEVEYWKGPGAPDARRLRRLLEFEGYTVYEWSDRHGTTYDAHSHPEDQSHWVISGALTLTVGGESYTLRAGDRDYLPAWTEHTARVEGEEPVIYLVGAKH